MPAARGGGIVSCRPPGIFRRRTILFCSLASLRLIARRATDQGLKIDKLDGTASACGLKISLIIPPVIALVLVAGWLGTQQRSISLIEEQSVVLQKCIAAARGSVAGKDLSEPGKPAWNKISDTKAPLDWQTIAVQLTDIRTMVRLQQRLHAMSVSEILAALDEVAALDISAAARELLEQTLFGPLVEKDPEAALTRFADLLRDSAGVMRWQLSGALANWGKKEPAKAGEWMDQQIAAGNFESRSLDGRDSLRAQFEGTLIATMISSGPQAAGARLAALPEDQRTEVMRHHTMGNLKEEDQKVFAEIVRAQLPEDAVVQTISQAAARGVSKGGYPEVTAYLDRIDATPAERKSTAEQAANSQIQQLSRQKGVSREDLDSMRVWVEAQAPGSADATTGKALGQAVHKDGKIDFPQAAALALEYHESSGNDEVLSNFLDGWVARQNQAEARVLAEKISDEKRREEILKKLE